MGYQGYHFFIGDLPELPYAPSELKVTIGSNNKTVELISGDEINILKNPKLTDIEFEIELPRGRQYGFANNLKPSKTYTDYFEKLMLDKTPTKLVITRPNPGLKTNRHSKIRDFESTVLTVSLQGYELKESANNAYDVTVSLKFKEYRSYGTIKKKVVKDNQSNQQVSVNTPTKNVTSTENYKVKQGDNLWKIARKFYGTANNQLVERIYNQNKTVIEQTAKKYGKKDSNKGWWIYPDTVLVIPKN